ncbi:MAG: SHOCT domain-containing protein [Acidimicrobiia bacterium]|nr:SHOCT domain-containing protein [Acidimicrobiia bacterium]
MPRLFRRAARTAVVAGVVVNRRDRKQAEQNAQSAPAPAAASDGDVTDELTKLASLHSDGVLTDEEFAAAKAKLLA